MNAMTIVPQPMPAFSMGDVQKIAEAIARGGLFGSRDPYAVLTLCLLAQAEGQHPAVVFRDYHVISGKPAKKADAMLRDFLNGGGKIEWHTLDDECADATFSHPAGGTVRIAWDKARVKQAQLGSNAMHAKYPRQMLRARVISEGVRTVYPGATSGLYVPDEVAEFDKPAAQQQLPAPVEDQPEAEAAPAKTRQPKLEGPIKTRAELRTACGALVRELHACDDASTLDALLTTEKALVDQVRDEAEFFWKGDGADFLGLEKEIEHARNRCADDQDQGDDGSWRNNVLAAG